MAILAGEKRQADRPEDMANDLPHESANDNVRADGSLAVER